MVLGTILEPSDIGPSSAFRAQALRAHSCYESDALAPMAATWLLAKRNGDPALRSAYLSALGAIPIVGVWFMKQGKP
jgi:hypothetical protein